MCAVHTAYHVLPNNVFVYTYIYIPVDLIHNARGEEGKRTMFIGTVFIVSKSFRSCWPIPLVEASQGCPVFALLSYQRDM